MFLIGVGMVTTANIKAQEISDEQHEVILNFPPTIIKQSPEQIRRAKCEVIVSSLYHHKGRAYFLPYCQYLIEYHAKLEREAMIKGDMRARGFSGEWWWSLVYGGANFSLRCYATAPGNCAGPLDVKHYPLITDPKANIRHHCQEMFGFYLQGVRGRDLCEHVMYPRMPHDWGGGRFAKTDQRHRKVVKRYYQEAK